MILKLARYFLAAVFIAAALLKIPHPEQMKTAIQGFRVVNESWAVFGAYFFPWMEFWAGAGLLAPIIPVKRAAAFIILGLMTLFIAVLISAWARGITLNCGCFGFYPSNGAPDDFRLLLVRDLGLWILAAAVFWRGEPADTDWHSKR
jgi:hypothetical protein